MTISVTAVRMNYVGSGSLSSYPYTFRVDDETDLEVQQSDSDDDNATTLVLNSDYTVTGVGSESGGNVILGSNLASGYHLAITRVSPRLQSTDLEQRGSFNPETIEDRFDRITMLIQELADDISRAAKVSRTGGSEGSEVDADIATSVAASAATASAAASAALAALALAGTSVSGTGTTSGATLKTFALADNSAALIQVFGAGLKGSSLCVNRAAFALFRTTGTTTITRINSEDYADGDDLGGYFEMEQSGDSAVLKAYTDSGTWAVSGVLTYPTSGTVSIS